MIRHVSLQLRVTLHLGRCGDGEFIVMAMPRPRTTIAGPIATYIIWCVVDVIAVIVAVQKL